MIYLILISIKLLIGSKKIFLSRNGRFGSIAMNISKVVLYMWTISTVRIPSQTSLDLSPLYSAAYPIFSPRCIKRTQNTTLD